jgi:hypothetical protein
MGMVVEKVAQHHRRAFQPRHPPQGGKIRLHHIVAIARLPAGRRIAVGRRHFEVGRQHVVAAMGFLVARLDEVLHMETLAHQAALHVDTAHQHGVDIAGACGRFQLVEGKVSSHVI